MESNPTLRPHRGVLVLVLGILSIVSLPILGPIAWILGSNDLRDMDEGLVDPTGRDLTRAGQVCGMIGTAFLAIGVLVLVGFLVFGVGVAFLSSR